MVVETLRHIAGLTAAAALLWFLWRRFDREDVRTRRIVAAGFLLRAFLAQGLFWISYLRLPVARSMQAGDGLWFFSLDAIPFFSRASSLAARGLWQFGSADPLWISRFYTQTIAAFIYFLGNSAAVGILLNLLSYLGSALLLIRWSTKRLPLLAISFAPTLIFWSLQPLKDPLFAFLLILFLFCLARFMETHRWPYALGLTISAYAIGGIRWYFGFVLALTVVIALAIDVFRATFRPKYALAAAGLFVLVMNAAAFGAAEQFPERLRPFVTLSPRLLHAGDRIRDVAYTIQLVRDNFDVGSGKTMIRPGPLVPYVPFPLYDYAEKRDNYARMILKSRPLPPKMIQSRLIPGLVAMLIPRVVAMPLGLVSIEGGRGLWLFADTQTIIFDVLVVFAIVAIVRAARARRLSEPMLWQLVVLSLLVGLAQAYTVSNFGTLFRHRDMIFVTLALLPFALPAPVAVSSEAQISADRLVGDGV